MAIHKHSTDDNTKGLTDKEKQTEGVDRRSRATGIKIYQAKQKATNRDGRGTR